MEVLENGPLRRYGDDRAGSGADFLVVTLRVLGSIEGEAGSSDCKGGAITYLVLFDDQVCRLHRRHGPLGKHFDNNEIC